MLKTGPSPYSQTHMHALLKVKHKAEEIVLDLKYKVIKWTLEIVLDLKYKVIN